MSTVHLPAMGQARPPVDMDFPWFGVTIRVAPDAGNPLIMTGFAEQAAVVDTADDASAMLIVMAFVRKLIHPEDWEEFTRVAIAHNQQTIDLLGVAKAIVTNVARFPTGRPSDSSDGPSSMNPTSSDDGYSTAIRTAMAKLAGRGDLKMIVYQQHLARLAEQN